MGPEAATWSTKQVAPTAVTHGDEAGHDGYLEGGGEVSSVLIQGGGRGVAEGS